MSESHPVSFDFEINVGRVESDLRRLQTIVYRSLGQLAEWSGSEEYKAQVRTIQNMITWLNRIRLAFHAVQAARMAAGDPLAWGMAFISVVEVGADVATELSGR